MPLVASQTFAVLSKLPVTMREPSGLYDAEVRPGLGVPLERHQVGMAEAMDITPLPAAEVGPGAVEQGHRDGDVALPPLLVGHLHRSPVLEPLEPLPLSFGLGLGRLRLIVPVPPAPGPSLAVPAVSAAPGLLRGPPLPEGRTSQPAEQRPPADPACTRRPASASAAPTSPPARRPRPHARSPARRPPTAAGRRPERRPWGSDRPGPSPGTSGRSSPGRGGPWRSASSVGSGGRVRTASSVSITLSPPNGALPVSRA